MFAIDIPTSVFVGFVFANAGKKIIKNSTIKRSTSNESTIDSKWEVKKINFLRMIVLLFNVFFFTPVPLIFLNGWPGWQMNYVAPWADNLTDSPLRACVTMFFFVITVVPAFLSFELGRLFIIKNKDKWVKICAVLTACIIALIIYLTRNATFNIATTYANFYSGKVFPFTHPPFIILLSITTTYSWGALILFYRWLTKIEG